MNILFLSQILPYPLDAGPKTRAYYVLRYLAQGHRVTLLSFVREADRPTALDHLRTFCDAVYTVQMRRSRLRDAQYLAQSLGADTPFLIARDTAPETARPDAVRVPCRNVPWRRPARAASAPAASHRAP